MEPFADSPDPPYYAVIFTTRMGDNTDGYLEAAERMEELAAQQPGFLGIESARTDIGITVSYWDSEEAIAAWKAHTEHELAREMGRARWYDRYVLRVAKVERAYSWAR